MERSSKLLKILLAVLIIAIIGIAVFFFAGLADGKTKTQDTEKSSGCEYIKYRDLEKNVSMTGSVAGSDKVTVKGETDLKVKKLSVKVGDKVKKGDVLCEFDSSDLKKQIEDMKTKAQNDAKNAHAANEKKLSDAKKAKDDNVKKAQQEIENATSRRDQAYVDYNNMVDQYNALIGEADRAYDEMVAATGDDANAKKANWESILERAGKIGNEADELKAKLPDFENAIPAAKAAYAETVKKADAEIKKAQDALDAEKTTATSADSNKELKALQDKIDRCVIKSPKDGVVTQVNAVSGKIPSSAELFTISNASKFLISGKVGEADINKISEDMSAEIKTASTGDKAVNGTVKRIERKSASGENQSEEGYTVDVGIDDSDSKLAIGETANVKIILDKRENALCIPYDAVISSNEGGYYVFVASRNSKGEYIISKRKIEKGFDGDDYLEVTSDNIHENDLVLTNPRGVSDGDSLDLTPPEK
ncbi:efflux RND transporter periplasmic adaptor subunit [Ruminococcus sp.]|uniref:efflux RND transporter periplasmic adaptor subunit n=1 Tax=Ruminococcus sp. TaxID=41978 RepID=UPI0025DDA6D4|nr:efflux RND transporter periplasmic adaptor subunit [Ruminococcus sp.]MCR4638308.1 efflux RND transporter periplasmic adaptor subunit [Ruminococcus sp.]